MFHENEDEVMKAPGVCCGGSSCWHMFAPSVRVKKPGSCVKHLRWLHIQLLVVLLAGQASSNLTSAAPSSLSLATASAQTSGVHYHISVIVDVTGETKDESEIKAWLCEVFQNDLKSCRSPSHEETTTAPTSPQTTYETTATTLQSYNTTTAAMSTALKNDTTTTAATSTALKNNTTTTAVTSTTLKNNTTTTAATSPALKNDTTTTAATSTALKNDTTTTAATSTALKNNTTTTAATSTALKNDTTTTAVTSTTLQIDTTTTGATSTTLKNNSTTTAVTSTTLQIDTTTTAATSTTLSVAKSLTASLPDSGVITPTPADTGKDKPSKKPNPSQLNKQRIARQIRSSVTQTSGVSNDNTTDPCQEIDVSCNTKTAIKRTTCTVMLKLKQSIPPCCILRTLCAASKASSDIHVVGTNADRTSSLQNECSSNPREESSCTYTGQTGASCSEESEIAYSTQNNSTHCAADKQNKTCSCSSYCNGTDAYYTFEMSIQDPEISSSYLETLMSKLRQPPKCSSSSAVPCPSLSVALFFKEATVSHEPRVTNIPNYRVILVFQRKVPICDVLAAVIKVLQSETEISFNNQVTRAGVYINYRETSQQVNTTSIRTVKKITSAYCGNSAGLLTSQFTLVNRNPKPSNVCTAIEESIMLHCQDGGNVFVLLDERCVWPVSTPGPNVTTAQPNTTTTLSVNVTAAQPNATTPSVNVTSSPLNTTTEALNATTAAANVTVTATLNTTATTANESVPVTIESADSQANALLELTRDVSMLNSSQVDQLVSQLENLLSGPTVSLALGNTSVQIVSNLLGASPETLSDSSERIIGIVDTVALKLVLDEKAEILLSPAVALSVKPADGTNFQETFFSISDPNDVEVRGDPRPTRSLRKEDSSIPQGSIRLPPSLTGNLSSEEQQLVSRVQFNFYQKSTVFQDRSLGERKLNSGILGASVANLSISELQDDIVIHLRHTEPIPGNFVSTCVFWDFTRNDGSGGWNPKGCNVRNSTDNETICGCDHLTSFAILLDLSREPLISRLQATILTFITFIGCGISAIFLSVTLLTYLAFGKLRKDIPSKILIQLCLALLLLNLVFLVDAWLALYPDTVGLCISTAWFLHYFLLVSFTWMGLEAVHMYLALVKVFNTYISRYMLKFSLVGWGVPMIVVIIVIAIDKDNYGLVSYGKFSDGTSDNFCWLKNDIAFYVAVVAYFCVIFLFNIVIFVVVLVQLCRIKRQNPHNALHRSTLQDVRSVTGITILLGLTWGFAFFAWGPLNLPFMYLFAIFNSLQGFFIFVFHCAVKENVRRQWRTYLCCGRMRLAENSEWSRTATQKTVKKSSVTRLTSLQSSKSSKSNNSTSSSSFLVSDSSEQINGIGSPFEDRAITTDEDPSMDVILNEINSQYRNQQAP